MQFTLRGVSLLGTIFIYTLSIDFQMESNCDSDNLDDEVDQEFDVYLSKRLDGKLYLLQYPVKKRQLPFAGKERISAKIKPNNNKLEIDVSLDVQSSSYDISKGEQISVNVDGNDTMSQSASVFDRDMMDKQTLQSTAVPSSGKRYVCGIIRDGEVHLSPISHVLQLRPSFKYMDQADHRAARAAKAKEAADADSSQDEADDARAVTIRVKGAETEAVRLARELSYAAYEKRLADEKWCPLKFYSAEDTVVELERHKLLCQKTISVESMMDRTIPDVGRTPSEYLNSLKPTYSEQTVDDSAMPENVLSLSLLKNKSLGDQIRLLMKNANIMTFTHLLSLLSGSPDPNMVVRSLQSYASLIKGCWIVKSEVVFPPDTVSHITGTPAESLCRSRDYILYMFTLKEFLSRKEMTATVKIPSDDVKAILDDVAVMKVGHGWKLRLNQDLRFNSRYPEVAERQGMLWKAIGSKLAKQMSMPGLVNEATTSKSTGVITSPSRKKRTVSGDEKTKSSKTTKKQRKPSGTKSNNSILKVHHETSSPSRAPKLPFVQLNGGNTPSCSSLPTEQPSLTTLLSPPRNPQIVSDLHALAGDINIANVNSTVQSIANEIYKKNSPNRSFVSQTHQNSSNLPKTGANVYVKQEKDT